MFLHLDPQICLVQSSATEYFDHVGGVTRNRNETIELSFGSWMRQHPDQIDTVLGQFWSNLSSDLVNQTVELAKSLPWRDGDIDIEAMGLTTEELIEMFKRQVKFPSVHDVLENFVRQATGQPY